MALQVLYDRDCRWCRFSVARLLRLDQRGELLPITIQSDEGQALLASVPAAERLLSAHVVDAQGVVHSGGDAAPLIVERLALVGPLAPLLRRVPKVARAAYDLVAGNRHRLGPLISDARLRAADRLIAEHRRRHFALGPPDAPAQTSCAVPVRSAT